MAQKTDFINGNVLVYLVIEKPNFSEEEGRILKYWEKINAFHK
jgi:hypothetical protein